MQRLVIEAPAKINLSLDVVGRRPDGYHLLSTVMQSLDLADRLVLTAGMPGTSIVLKISWRDIPTDRRNTAYRAAEFFLQAAGILGAPNSGLMIEIRKRIPAAAGLAGASADAAGVLFGLNALFPGCLKPAQLYSLATRIGADVPFCLQGGTVLCEGIGELMTPLSTWDGLNVLICKPDQDLLTSWVFGHLDLDCLGRRPDQPAVLAAIRNRSLSALAAATANVLESVSMKALPELAAIKQALLDAGARLALMSGSGPTLFALFDDQGACEQARQRLAGLWPDLRFLLSVKTTEGGPRIATAYPDLSDEEYQHA